MQLCQGARSSAQGWIAKLTATLEEGLIFDSAA